MAKIPRSESEVAQRPQPLPFSSGDGFEAPGKALASFGQAASTLAGEYQKEQDKEESFQSRLRSTNFVNQQDMETIRRENEQTGDPTGYTQQRITDYGTAAQTFLKTIPPKQQNMARLIIEQHGGSTAEQAARFEYGRRKTMLATETEATITGTMARLESADPDSLDKVLSLSDKIISDAPLPESVKQQLRSHAASVAYSRVIELAGPDARDVGQKIINDWSGRLSTPDAISRRATKTSAAGIEAIKQFEGSKDQGWDYQQYSGPYGVKRGKDERLTLAEAEGRLKDEVAKVETDMAGKIKQPLTQNQHDALVSFFYNLGTGKGRLDKVADLINSGKADQVPAYMRQFTRAGGEQLTGLVRRRNEEARMFSAGGSAPVSQPSSTGDQMASAESTPGQGLDSGQPVSVGPRPMLPSSKSHLVETFVKAMPQLNEIWLKRQEQINAAAQVQGFLDGSLPFNPQDEKSRKLINNAFSATEVGPKLFAGDPVTMAQAVNVSNRLNYVPDPVADSIKGLIRQNDPDKKAIGYQSAASILAKQPNAFDAVQGGEKVRKEASEFTALTVERGKSTKEALAIMAEWETPEWQAKAETRKKAADDAVKALKGNEFQDSIQGWFEFEPVASEVSGAAARLKADYTSAFRDNFVRYGDADIANAVTKAEMGRIWGRSEFLGRKDVMRYPFEKFYPAVGGKYDLYQKDLSDAVKQAAKEDVKPANIYLVPDERTQREVITGKPTYAVTYVDKNGILQTVPGARWPQAKNVEDVTGAFTKEFERQRKEKMGTAPEPSKPIITEPKDNPNAPHMLLREGAKSLWNKLTTPEPDPGPSNTIPGP